MDLLDKILLCTISTPMLNKKKIEKFPYEGHRFDDVYRHLSVCSTRINLGFSQLGLAF